MRSLKNDLSLMANRILSTKRVLQTLTEDDEEMCLMQLTLLKYSPRYAWCMVYGVYSVQYMIHTPYSMCMLYRLYIYPLHSDILNTHDEIEELLESYLIDFSALEMKMLYMKSQIQSAEELVSMLVCLTYVHYRTSYIIIIVSPYIPYAIHSPYSHTCHCTQSLYTSYAPYTPYIFTTSPHPHTLIHTHHTLQVSLRLDTSRNELLIANTALAVLACSIGFGAYLTGIFGMNLDNVDYLQPVDHIFMVVCICSFVCIVCIFLCILYYLRAQGMLPVKTSVRVKGLSGGSSRNNSARVT